MVRKWPDLERGESANETGRDHIPPRVFKEMTRLDKQRERLEELLTGVTPFNSRSRTEEIAKILDTYIPDVSKMASQVKKFTEAYKKLSGENQQLKKENAALEKELDASRRTSVMKKLEDAQLRQSYEAAVQVLESMPPELVEAYRNRGKAARSKERAYEKC